MSTEGKKCDGQSVPLDVLSSLPENVVDDILVFLPLRDAVRTSILSTKWRYKWCRIPQLKLDEEFWASMKHLRSSSAKITNVIYHLLISHAGPISKFILSICKRSAYPEIDKFIYFLSKNGIQHLDLTFYPGNPNKLMPSSIFTCLQLRHLSLQYCSILLAPPAFKGFDRLISLELRIVTIPTKFLESLISNSPLLEQLVLWHNVYTGPIEINAPILRSFDFIEAQGSIFLKSVPRLAKLSLWHKKYHVGTRNCLESFYHLEHLEHLELNGRSLKFLVTVAAEVPTRLPFVLNHVKRLRLSRIKLAKPVEVLRFLCLIRSCPFLQYFEIQVSGDDDGIPTLECLELEAFSDVTFNDLKAVELTSTIGSEPEMQLIKLLLAKSPMLERMLIKPVLDGDYASETIKIPILLNSFKRASPNVVVIYDLE